MKTLLIMRHADATWPEDQWVDFERPLNDDGLLQAPRMGRRLREAGYRPEGVVSSAARRTMQTAEAVAAEVASEVTVESREHLYMAQAGDWASTIPGLPQRWSTALCVGHNPGIQEVIILLKRNRVSVPPATLAIVRLGIDRWDEFVWECPIELMEVWRPDR